MPSTTRKPREPDPDAITAAAWAAGDGVLQVPLSGLLAHDPALADARLRPEAWKQRLDEYLATPCP